MYVLVIGCGRTGSAIANLLSGKGENVVVIDKHDAAFNRLSVEFTGFTIAGDAAEIEVLKEAKIEKSDVAVVTTDRDSVNAMVAQIASELYDVPEVIVKVIDPQKEIIYRDLGLHTLSQTNLFVDEFKDKLTNWMRGEM